MPPMDDAAALASNWRKVLAFDAGLGALALVAGLATVLLGLANIVLGSVLAVAGAAYLSLVGVRARRWQRLRRAANL